MWEQIRANRRKTAILVVAMAGVLFALGYIIGEVYGAGLFGLTLALAVWAVLTTVAFFQGDNILLAVAGAKKIEKSDHPELFNVVEEMTIASGLGKMPDVYVIDDTAMNAFAVGRNKDKTAVAVTAGLLGRLNRDELQGVIAHEVAHIVNRDVLLMSMIGVMLGAIVMISQGFLRSLWFGSVSGSRYRSRSRGKGEGGGQALVIVLAIVLAILAPILAQLIYLAVSRKREYMADASGAVFTRYPEGLASALEQLGKSEAPVQRANKATAAMYIVNPFTKAKLSAMSRTHPPTGERINILRSFGNAATYAGYQEAWSKVAGGEANRLPASALSDTEHGGGVRKAHRDAKRRTPRQQMREVGDLMRTVNQFVFLPCVCGLKLKLPPDFNRDHIDCPKCGRTLEVPVAQLAAAHVIAEQIGSKGRAAEKTKSSRDASDQPLRVQRTPGEWMTFKCACGKTKTISPGFTGTKLSCKNCGRTIEIE